MKRIIAPILLLLASGFILASCGNSAPQHSKSFNAGVAWVMNDFDGANQQDCDTSVLVAANATSCVISKNLVVCASQAASSAVIGYNMQQWIDGCASVPFKDYPKWYKNYVYSLNN